MTETADDVVLPALLRAARGAYGFAIRRRLAEAGYGDVPRNAPYLLGGMANHGFPADGLLREMGVREETAQRLVETLVTGGYLARGDELEVTQRGRAAAAEVKAAIESVDAELESMLSPSQLEGLRAGLVALTTIRERLEAGL